MRFKLPYGALSLSFGAPANDFDIIGVGSPRRALSDAEIGLRFDAPIDSPPVEELVGPGESVLIVVPDATRRTACDSAVNLLVRRLIANGTMPYDMAVVFATGIHRPVSNEEKRDIIGPFIFQRIKTHDHSAQDLMRSAGLDSAKFATFGDIDGVPIELNRILTEFEHVIVIGGVSFHYFAGFTGGRKLICPGLASARTIAATHRLAFDFEAKRRRDGVGPGILSGNAVHEAFLSVASNVPPVFAISSIVDASGNPTDFFCGDWQTSHRAACERFSEDYTIRIDEKRDLVIASCGGSPYDVNLIQAHKALDAASRACNEGGTIVLAAECGEGLGRADFLKWFEPGNASGLVELLCERYEVNGQTAWSLLEKTERFDVRIVTTLDAETLAPMKLKKARSLNEFADGRKGYVIPFGAKFLIEVRG